VDDALEKQGLKRSFRLTVPHYVALGDVLGHSDLIATVPERFAQRVMAPFGLTTRPLPLDVEVSAIHQFWHARLHKDPGHQWLRALVLLPLPIAAIYTSGGQSIHALVRMDAEDKPTFDAIRDELVQVVCPLGADAAAMTAVGTGRISTRTPRGRVSQ
jgi:hypothetical protein